jgi:tellurite resistance protein
MSESGVIIELVKDDPGRLAAAVEAAMRARAPSLDWIREGARESARGEWTAAHAARKFQTLLEIGYLVASADGFADQERTSLASLLEKVTGSAVDHEMLELHFRDLDEAVTLLGRRERLLRSAAELEDAASAEEAISLVAMISMADGVLSAEEFAVLVDLGRHAEIDAERVRALVDRVAAEIGSEMA